MRNRVVMVLIGATTLTLGAVAANAVVLTVNSILAAQQAGAPADGIISMIDSPGNTIAMTASDIHSLRTAGVPESVLSAIKDHIPVPSQAYGALVPDDARLVEVVRLVKTGTSESIIVEQVRRSGQSYNLSVNDVLYLKENGAGESTITALMAARTTAPSSPASTALPASPAVTPSEVVFDDLMLVNGFWKKDRTGRMLLQGDTLAWKDSGSPGRNFEFQTAGLEKVWFTCEARSSGNFCYEINFQIVKGDRYRFRDMARDSGSNDAVVRVMEALRTYFPRLTFSKPEVKD